MNKRDSAEKWVFVVDDDPQIRRSLTRLLEMDGYRCRAFDSAPSYLSSKLPHFDAACLVLDIRMPEMSGLELQERLANNTHDVPIVFITAYGDIPTCIKTLKAGAVSFLTKPFEASELLKAVEEALQRSDDVSAKISAQKIIRTNFDLLTPRERDVFRLVTQGMLNKQIAATLDIAEITVKIHRARVMSKMGVQSITDLVRLAAALD